MTPTPTAPGINPNLLTSLMQAQGTPSLQLTQIDKYDPPAEFTDSAGSRWLLVKDSRSGAGEVPDPAGVNVTDYWMHEFPGSGGKIFLYVVEGLRPPKTQREAPCRVLYSWYSTVNCPSFTPQLIRPQEWLVANVYAAGLSDSRVSKLRALCKVPEPAALPETVAGSSPEQPAPLISMEDLRHDTAATGTTRAPSPDNPGERRKNNR